MNKYQKAWMTVSALSHTSINFKCYRDEMDIKLIQELVDKAIPKQNKTKLDNFPSTPVNCFIDNEDVNGKSVQDKLDRQFYINMAKERVQGYGI